MLSLVAVPDLVYNAYYELKHVVATTSIRESFVRGDSGVLMGYRLSWVVTIGKGMLT